MASKSDSVFQGGNIQGGLRTGRADKPGSFSLRTQTLGMLQPENLVMQKVVGSPGKDVAGIIATQLSHDIAGYLHDKAEDFRKVKVNNELTNRQLDSQAFTQNYLGKVKSGLGLTDGVLKDFDSKLEEGIKDFSDDEKDQIRVRASGLRKSIGIAAAVQEKNTLEEFNALTVKASNVSLLDSVSENPENAPALKPIYDSNTDIAKGSMSAVSFDKLKLESKKVWMLTLGEALIRRNPTNWESVLKREDFKGVSHDTYDHLLKYGTQQKEKLEKKVYRERKLAEIDFEKGQSKLSSFVCKEIRKNPFDWDEEKVAATGLKGKHLYDTQGFMIQQQKSENEKIKGGAKIAEALSVSELELGLEAGTKDSADIQEYFAAGKITETTRNDLLKKYIHAGKTENKKAAAKQEIEEHVESETPAPLVSTERKNEYFMDSVQGKSLPDIIEYAKKNAIVFDANIAPVKNACETSIMNGNDAKTVMDACAAIKDNENVPVIKGIDKDCVDFANLAVVMFKGDENVNNVLSARDEYFRHDDANVTEHRKKLWEESDYHKKPAEATDKFYGKNGFEGWFKSINKVSKPLLDAEVQGTVKRVYEKTGSFSKAEAVANEYVKNLLQVTDINGRSGEYMINPPTPENTGFTKKQIDKITDDSIKDSIADLRKAGEKIDILATKREAKFMINGEKEKRKVYYEGVNPKAVQGNLYYLLNEDDPNSREYLINPTTGRRAVVDFEKLKNIASNKLAGIK